MASLAVISVTLVTTFAAAAEFQLTSVNDNYLSMVAGFTARMQCSVYRCTNVKPVLSWLKDDLVLFNGTDFIPTSGFEPENTVLQYNTLPDSKGCATDDYTLLLKNLSLQDSGKYRCSLNGLPVQLDFHLNVLESGLKFGFNQNITYDYTECCIERGISPLCRSMCRPRDMHLEFFDPTSCKTNDYKNFLSCATNGGQKSFVPCCRKKNVPGFCFDFCSSEFQMLKRSHRLCLYYLPEIFQCFSEPHSDVLDPPTDIHYWRETFDKFRLCWPQQQSSEPVGYTVHLKEWGPDRGLDSSLIEDNQTRRQIRSADIIVAKQTRDSQVAQFYRVTRISSSNPDEICIHLDGLHARSRYVVYLQARNHYGVSEPSAPLFIS